MKPDDYEKLLMDNVTKTKAPPLLEKSINSEAKAIAKPLQRD